MNFEEVDYFFSFSEELDLHLHSLSDWNGNESDMLEFLEGASKEVRRKASSALYSLLMKDCNSSRAQWISSIQEAAMRLSEQGALPILANYLALVSEEINSSEHSMAQEQELRTALNILFLMFKFLPQEELKSDTAFYSSTLEDALMHLIKISTEISFIPIKKVSMLYLAYIELILDFPNKNETKFSKEILEGLKAETPRHRIPPNNAVEMFYRRMMRKENPLPQIIVVGLLRALLNCCPNANTNGVDIKEEWLSPLRMFEENEECFAGFRRRFNCQCQQCNESTHSAEHTRHKFITGLYISKIFLLLMMRFKLNHIVQFSYLSQLMADANGILVFLKFLNQDFSGNEVIKTPALPCFSEIHSEKIVEDCISTMLKVTYKLVKNHPERIKDNLIQYKSSLIFKRILNKLQVEEIQIDSLKLLRVQVKYLNKKWKSYPSNMHIISAIYHRLQNKGEDWINDIENTETLTADEVRQINHEFNFYHYWQGLDQKIEDSPQLPQDFHEKYEEWLEENVWGYNYMF
ncbi:unnamed protein product [Blepharisma stoltei]|uniref:Far11/STRP C-terminal domain-containing protein n=1 Tax=Blepharisma stoltei TaxID=1481888 RepID=A0AAU9IHC0_9CILI|nr:unnamed protein product [Blepharisma stoltei]